MTPTNLPASIRARLRNLAEHEGADFGAILTRYALERMLYRISIGESRDEFLLKGALLFDAWFDTPSRPTRDIDLHGFGLADDERLRGVFRAACSLDVDDGITFDPRTVSTTGIRKAAGYPGIRVTIRGELGRGAAPRSGRHRLRRCRHPRADNRDIPRPARRHASAGDGGVPQTHCHRRETRSHRSSRTSQLAGQGPFRHLDPAHGCERRPQ